MESEAEGKETFQIHIEGFISMESVCQDRLLFATVFSP